MLGEVKVTFTSLLDQTKINLDAFNASGFEFKVLPNQEYLELLKDQGLPLIRDLNISAANLTEIGFNFVKFQLNFSSVAEMSKGGVGFEDLLFVDFPIAELLHFEPQTVTNPFTGE